MAIFETKKVYSTLCLLALCGGFAFVNESNLLAKQKSLLSTVSQQASCSGKVVDVNGNPLVGVSVLVKGTTNGAITDDKGLFSLSNVKVGSTLQFSCIGFNTVDVKFEGKALTITLKEDQLFLNDLVVVGYGTVRKADVAGSIAVMDNKAFKGQPVSRVANALEGRVAGVQVENSGVPGGKIKIRVRGANSVNLNNDPLFVVDGVVRPNGIDDINPDDIKSIQVLKDASSTSIYGSRGANGVILVTTKTGVSGQTIISFDAECGIANVPRKYNILSPYEYALAWKHYNPTQFTDEQLADFKSGKAGVNWQDEFIQTGVNQNYRVAISKGNDKTQYYISANYVDEKGIFRFTDYKRYGARLNLTSDVTNWLKVSTDVQLNHSYRHGASYGASKDNLFFVALNTSPITTIMTPDGKYFNNQFLNQSMGNPLAGQLSGKNASYANSATGNIALTFKLYKGLTFTTTNSFDFRLDSNYGFNSKRASEGAKNGANNGKYQNVMLQSTNNLTYMNSFGKHNITGTLVWEATSREWSNLNGTAKELPTEVVGYWNLSLGKIQNVSNGYGRETLLSGLGRFIYNYADKYTVTLTMRADGSSKFLKHKWGYFPSVALSWDAANEDFIKKYDIFQTLKLRTSYGIIGNQSIGAYSTLGLLNQVQANYGTLTKYSGYTLGNPASPDLTWEKTSQFDLGLDFTVLNGRLGVSLDYFYKMTTNCLMDQKIPGYLGGGSQLSNVGRVDNTGFDFSVTGRIFQSEKGFNWTATLNGTYLHNEVKNIGSNPFIMAEKPAAGMLDESNIILPGNPIGAFYGYVWKGIDKNTGYNVYADLNKDGKIDGNDRKVIGSAIPSFTFGFNNQMSYKNFELTCFITGSFGAKRLNLVRYSISSPLSDASFINLKEAYNQNFDIVADKSKAKFATLSNGGRLEGASTQWLENASYVRLANLSLTYHLSKKVAKVADMRFTISAQNLFTITPYKGMDPSSSAFAQKNVDTLNGIDLGAYPTPRAFTLGVKLDF